MKHIAFVLYALLHIAASHSWLHCVNYDKNASLMSGTIDNSKCMAYPRDITSEFVFGVDRGIDYQPANGKPCRTSSGLMVNYRKGGTYRFFAGCCRSVGVRRGYEPTCVRHSAC